MFTKYFFHHANTKQNIIAEILVNQACKYKQTNLPRDESESEKYLLSHFPHNLLLNPGQVYLLPLVKVNLSISLEANVPLHILRLRRFCPPGFCLRRSHCSPGCGVERCPWGADAVRHLETFGSCQHSTFAWRSKI